MIHPQLRLAAAKFALHVATVDDLVEVAHATLNAGYFADGLVVLATTPNMQFWEVSPHFEAALRDLDHAFPSPDDALRYLRLSYFAPAAEGVGPPHEALLQYYRGLFSREDLLRWLADLPAWRNPSVEALMDHGYERSRQLSLAERSPDPLAPGQARWQWEHTAVQLCREWCREYSRLYLQPTWRTETVVALAAGIHAERAFDRLPILADALEEAGCDHPDLLAHCRYGSPHTDYCWLINVLTEVN